jgi:hypothetical protein
MVTPLRPGSSPLPPLPLQRATEGARLPETLRDTPGAEGAARTEQTRASRAAPTAAPLETQSQTPADPSRPLRTSRPGSLVDIRV